MLQDLCLNFVAVFLLAFLLGDFILQHKWFEEKEHVWYWRLLHSIILAALTYLLMSNWTAWSIPLFISAVHYFSVWYKTTRKEQNLNTFLLDKGAHFFAFLIAVIWAASASMPLPAWISWQPPWCWNIALCMIAALLLLPFGGTMIGKLMDPLQAQIGKKQKGLKNGGKIIGYLERMLILTFVMVNQYAGIGFLVAAKSIFRFSEIKEDNDRKEAEYIIIGTFSSFLYAIVISIFIKRLWIS